MPSQTHSTACILCSENCGLNITTEGRRFTRIVGNPGHVSSEGYICQKAARLDHYQNHGDRLTQPLRRRGDGGFEPVTWDVAIREIADRMKGIKQRHGGQAFAYYGGGGQGNHLGGVYGSGLRAALGTRFYYSALSQEKTGDFWVNGKLFGRQTCHVTDDVHHAQCVVFIGTNPWQAHGIPQARRVVKALAKDPERTMIVIDPRRTETAARADLHLQVRPGTDAWLITALLAVMVQEGLCDEAFLEARTTGFDRVRRVLERVPVSRYADIAGVSEDLVRDAAGRMAAARSTTIRADLGLQQSLHSTLNSYLEKLLFLVTGNFARRGGNNLHTFLLPLIGHSKDVEEGGLTSTVTDMPEIAKLFPPNRLPAEIDTDHDGRVRALIVDSANPARSAADTDAYRKAFDKLELLVTIDVAMTETAASSHYVLPASTQYEKWEATFFNLTFPVNHFHLRAPVLEPEHDTLPEPEIYRRLVVALGAMPERFPALERLAVLDRKKPGLRLLEGGLATLFATRPKLKDVAPLVLYQTLGKALPDGAQSAAVLWFAARQYAQKHGPAVRATGLVGEGPALGEALFDRMLHSRDGVELSRHRYDDVWKMIRHPDGRIHLHIETLLDQVAALEERDAPGLPDDFPLVLIAGERRAYNANTIYRNPDWRKNDTDGALRMHPDDASGLSLADGDRVRCTSRAGAVEVRLEVDDALRPGMVTLPHGYGLAYPDASGQRQQHGPAINDLTRAEDCDPIAGTPHHKYVPVRVSPIRAAAPASPS